MNLIEYFKGDEMAASVWKDKYAAPGEQTPNDMHRRLAKEIARKLYERPKMEDLSLLSSEGQWFYGSINKLSLSELEEFIFSYFKNFSYIIPQGSIMSTLGRKDIIASLSNCFVIGQVPDSYGGIMQKDQQLVQLMKRRGGVGLGIDNLRPENTFVSNAAGSSTGAISFMHRFSNTTREVAQKGRRGALMITIDIRHPDVLEFIRIKRDKTQVTGANISIQLRDDFMEAVKKEEDYLLRWPVNKEFEVEYPTTFEYNVLTTVKHADGTESYVRRIKAKEYYDEISQSAWECAEPGQMFKDRHIDYSPDGVYSEYRFVTTNPCGEIGMGMYDACRLLALNFFSVVKNSFSGEAFIDFNLLHNISYVQQTIADIIVDLELEHIDGIINKIQNDPEDIEIKRPELELWENIRRVCASSRRTGSGFTALGDMLAALGVSYNESINVVEKVMKTKFKGELDATIDMSILFGPFEGYNPELEFHSSQEGSNAFFEQLASEFPEETIKMIKHGRRNVSWSTVAPTGTVSVMTQTTSGIEPLFAPYYTRRRKINPDDIDKRVDFIDQNGDKWMEYPVIHPKLKDWIELQNNTASETEFLRRYDITSAEEVEEAFKVSPWFGSIAPELDWKKRIEIQAIVQHYTTHSISSTINLSKETPVEVIKDIYMEAYDKQLKGITVYRDGSRSGVLITNPESTLEFEYVDAVKRPKSLPVDIHTTISKGIKWNVIVGLHQDKPYEVLALPYFTTETQLELEKKHKGRYDLVKDSQTYSEDITAQMTHDQEVISRLISTSLRHRADIKFIVEQLNKTEGDITSFAKAIARTLKKYIPEGAASTLSCLDCGGQSIIFEEGCQKCTNCGSTKCG